jgi:stage V sporulation protein S
MDVVRLWHMLRSTGFLSFVHVTQRRRGLPTPPLGDARMDIIKVAKDSRSTSVAGAIAGVVREHGRAEVQAVGAGAVNQAVKAVIIARGYLTLDGIDVICIPVFTEVYIGDQERTAIRFVVEPR